jgi:putative PEP-CTERM system TPR-repeat lipoprotein
MPFMKDLLSIVRVLTLASAFLVIGCGRLDPEAELAAAAASLSARNYSEAAIRLNNVIQAQPDNGDARRLRGELSVLLGDYAVAADELERARSLGVPLDSIALHLAEARTVVGQPQDALELLDSVGATLASDPMYWTTRAEALLGTGKTNDAERALEAADRVGGGGARAQIAHAQVAFARGEPAVAEALLNRELSAAPDEAGLLIARAGLYARTERWTEAVADYQRAADIYRAAALNARELTTLLTLVQVNLARNDLAAAEATATRLAELAPQAALTAYSRGLVEYHRGNFDEAAAQIQPLVSAAPETAPFRTLLGAIHLARGNFGQAEQQFQAVLARSPRDPAAIKLLAETRLRQQRPDAALAALRAVEDVAAEDAEIGFLRGLASLQTGNTQEGLIYLEQAAALDPGNELLKLELARAYLAAGRDADASKLMEDTFGGGAARLEAGLLRLFAAIRSSTPDDGRAAATELLTEFPDDPRALLGAASYFQLQGENQRARELFEQAAERETDGATARLIVAAALVREGRSQDAEALLARVIEQDPGNAQALTALAQLLLARDATDEAAQLFTRAAEQTTAVWPRVALAQLHLRQSDFAAARRELDVAAVTDPDNADVAALRGLLALAEGDANEAVTLLRRAEASLPNRLGVVLALARAEVATGSTAAARATLQSALEAAPRSLPLRLALGEVELVAGGAAEVQSIATELKADYPNQSAGYLLEGEALVALRRYSAAAGSFSMAYARKPTWPVLTRLLGALQLADRPTEALEASEAWVAANPEHVPGTLLFAGLLQGAGRNEEALRTYEAVLSSAPESVIALNNAAWLTHELGRPGALELAVRAGNLAADNAAVLDTLGWILLAEDRAQEAATYLERAVELAPEAAEIRYHFAEALAAVGRTAEARSELSRALRGDLESEVRANAQRLLDSL